MRISSASIKLLPTDKETLLMNRSSKPRVIDTVKRLFFLDFIVRITLHFINRTWTCGQENLHISATIFAFFLTTKLDICTIGISCGISPVGRITCRAMVTACVATGCRVCRHWITNEYLACMLMSNLLMRIVARNITFLFPWSSAYWVVFFSGKETQEICLWWPVCFSLPV